jgi:cytochrome b involved in lipid metabolism
MNKNVFTIIVLILIAAGIAIWLTSDNGTNPADNELPTPTVNGDNVDEGEMNEDMTEPATSTDDMASEVDEATSTEVMMYSLEDIAEHATPEDCWFAVNGSVYDVTAYIAGGLHPGEEAILQGCGLDATMLYTTDPDESGVNSHAHSETAFGYLKNFQIGTLAE